MPVDASQCLAPAWAEPTAESLHGFTQVDRQWIEAENAYGTLYLHDPSGLSLFHLEDDAEALSFSIGFITPPQSDKGANHVLEHAVLFGSEKYPIPNLMQHLRGTSLAWTINAVTNDQTTAYIIRTGNEADYYNLMDVYINAVFHPLILTEENIFLQQGMRWEVTADGVIPNGIVYNELRQNSLETGSRMLLDVARALNAVLFEDSTSGYATFSIIVSGMPRSEVDGLIESTEQYLQVEMETLLTSQAMQDALSTYEWMVEDGYGWTLYSTLQGFVSDDPYMTLEKEADFAFLREEPSYLQTVWQGHIVDTPHRAVVTAPQQANEDLKARSFTEAETEQLQAQTDAFHAWVDTPETAEQLKSLPLLRISDYALKDLNHPYDAGVQDGIHYWLQPGEASEGQIALAVPCTQERWLDLSLLARTISYDEDSGIAYLFSYDDPETPGNIMPKLIIHPMDMENGIGSIADMLIDPDWLSAEKIADVLALEVASVSQYLGNAYSLTLEALYSDISPTNRFSGQTLGLIGNGTAAYLAYLQEISAQPPEEVAEMLRELAHSLADREGMMVYMRRDDGALAKVLTEITEAFPVSEGECQFSTLPPTEGTHSSLVITAQAESTVHYLQAGVFDDTDWQRDGHMDIMAQVLQNGYVLPELRNKRGALRRAGERGKRLHHLGRVRRQQH